MATPRKGHIRIHELNKELQDQIGFVYDLYIDYNQWILNSNTELYEYEILYSNLYNPENTSNLRIYNLEAVNANNEKLILGYKMDFDNKKIILFSDENISIYGSIRYIFLDDPI